MRKLLGFVFVVSLLLPAVAAAQNAFNGTWKFELKTAQFPEKPDVYLLQGGMYDCKTCVPEINIKADGQDQKVSGHPYYDMVSIKVVDDRTIQANAKKNGKEVATSKTWITPDGKTMKNEFSDSSNTNAAPVTGKGEETRVEKGPAGAHVISGSWRTTKLDTLSENALLVTFKVSADSLSMSNPTGQSYTAKLDGTDAPYKGDPGLTSVSVKKIGANAIDETDKRDGKVISIAHMVISADGKTMTLTLDDKLHGTTAKYTAQKQ